MWLPAIYWRIFRTKQLSIFPAVAIFDFETNDQQGGDKDKVMWGGKGRFFTLPRPLSRFPSLPPVTCAQERLERILVLPHRLKDRLRDILMSSHAPFRLEFYVQLNLSKTATLET